ncbi:UNVERIFIED_CONTAM: putative mitochondrial protein [Sesamum latifolium]|uniref:Mitochondrial protein n=1 Tax=Sesamum latifolium TaxID=2727402 RepID=A0AAW2T9D9_9LAMI
MGHMMLKLDISKVYDKIEWSFLWAVLFKLGFPEQFVKLILICVSSVSYSFVMSGFSFGTVTPQRGLRQGDPLSPYLFLLCTEAISSLLQESEDKGHLKGVAVCRRGCEFRICYLLTTPSYVVKLLKRRLPVSNKSLMSTVRPQAKK